MFGDKLAGLLLSQRFWVTALGLVGVLGHDLLGFDDVEDVEALAGGVLLVVNFVYSYAKRQPASPGQQ